MFIGITIPTKQIEGSYNNFLTYYISLHYKSKKEALNDLNTLCSDFKNLGAKEKRVSKNKNTYVFIENENRLIGYNCLQIALTQNQFHLKEYMLTIGMHIIDESIGSVHKE